MSLKKKKKVEDRVCNDLKTINNAKLYLSSDTLHLMPEAARTVY